MRARLLVAALAAVTAVLLVPGTAHAKGADQATIEGDDLAAPIVVSGQEGDGGTLGVLTDLAGLFPASFRQTPDPMLVAEPPGPRGPKYVISWRIPSGDTTAQTVVQDVYPFAEGGPLTYMAPGQVFMGTDTTRGGWYRSIHALIPVLVRLGVPDRAPVGTAPTSLVTTPATAPQPAPASTVAPATQPARPSSDAWWEGAAGVVLLATLAGAGAIGATGLARRRGRVAPT